MLDTLEKTRHTRGLCAVALAKEQSGYPGLIKLLKFLDSCLHGNDVSPYF